MDTKMEYLRQAARLGIGHTLLQQVSEGFPVLRIPFQQDGPSPWQNQ